MTLRRPIVNVTGSLKELPAGDTLPVASIDLSDFAQATATTTGLTYGYQAGTIRSVSGNGSEIVAAGTIALSNNATNYVQIDSQGTVSKNTTGFTNDNYPMAVVLTSAGAITAVSDERAPVAVAGPPETTSTIGTLISGATAKTTPVDADTFALGDSTASNIVRKFTWANLKTMLGALYAAYGYTTTATAAGTTTLTVASTYLQFFTGTTTQTAAMPVTSTLTVGQAWKFVNKSTGAVTINSSGGNAILVMAPGTKAIIECILITGTTAASWEATYLGAVIASGKVATINNTLTLAGTDGTTMTFPGTSATIARTDAAQSFTGTQTFTDVIANGLMRKNFLFNGAMNVAQYATTYAVTASISPGSLDLWPVVQLSSASAIFNQSATSVPTGFKNCAKMGRNNGSALTNLIIAFQVLESIDSIALQGKTVTLSYYAKAGANYSAASSLLGVIIDTGTGTDQTAQNGGWTGSAVPLNTTQAITTSWVRYQHTVTLSSSLNQVGLRVYYTPVGTAGADDNVYFTGVQLEIGSVATDFEFRPYVQDLAFARRYFRKQAFYVPATTAQNLGIIEMRTTPTISGGGAGFTSTGTTADQLIAFQTAGAVATLSLSAVL